MAGRSSSSPLRSGVMETWCRRCTEASSVMHTGCRRCCQHPADAAMRPLRSTSALRLTGTQEIKVLGVSMHPSYSPPHPNPLTPHPPPITHHPSPIPTPTPHPLHSCTLSACGRTMRTTARGVGSRRCRTGRRHVVRLCYLRAGCTSTALPSVTTAGPAHCAGMQMLCPYAMLRVLRCHWLHGWHRMGIRCQALHCLQH